MQNSQYLAVTSSLWSWSQAGQELPPPQPPPPPPIIFKFTLVWFAVIRSTVSTVQDSNLFFSFLDLISIKMVICCIFRMEAVPAVVTSHTCTLCNLLSESVTFNNRQVTHRSLILSVTLSFLHNSTL